MSYTDTLGARVLSSVISQLLDAGGYPIERNSPTIFSIPGNGIAYQVTVSAVPDLTTFDRDAVTSTNPFVGDSVLAAGDAIIDGFTETGREEKEGDDGTFAEERQMAIGVASYFRPRSRAYGGTRRGRLKS